MCNKDYPNPVTPDKKTNAGMLNNIEKSIKFMVEAGGESDRLYCLEHTWSKPHREAKMTPISLNLAPKNEQLEAGEQWRRRRKESIVSQESRLSGGSSVCVFNQNISTKI